MLFQGKDRERELEAIKVQNIVFHRSCMIL